MSSGGNINGLISKDITLFIFEGKYNDSDSVCPSVPHLLTGVMVKNGQDRLDLEGMILKEHLKITLAALKPLFTIIAEIRPTCCRVAQDSYIFILLVCSLRYFLLKIVLKCVDIHALISNHDPPITLDRNITLLKC